MLDGFWKPGLLTFGLVTLWSPGPIRSQVANPGKPQRKRALATVFPKSKLLNVARVRLIGYNHHNRGTRYFRFVADFPKWNFLLRRFALLEHSKLLFFCSVTLSKTCIISFLKSCCTKLSRNLGQKLTTKPAQRSYHSSLTNELRSDSGNVQPSTEQLLQH